MASGQNISPSPGTPDNGGGGVMGMGGGASGASSATNPRKFSEKIALHKQREAEEKKEFEKMMNELKAVKGPSPQRVRGTDLMAAQKQYPRGSGINANKVTAFSSKYPRKDPVVVALKHATSIVEKAQLKTKDNFLIILCNETWH